MNGATKKLIAMMIRNKNFADYIENSWNALYNDILNTHFNKWHQLDEISAYAICDYAERHI